MADPFDTTHSDSDTPGIAAKKARLRALAPADATAVAPKTPPSGAPLPTIKGAADSAPEKPSALRNFMGALKSRASSAGSAIGKAGSGIEKVASMTSDALKPVSDSALDADKQRFIKQPLDNAKAAAMGKLKKLVGMRGL